MTIDLRSDTVTKPTRPMLEAMFAAPVGDDVFGDDPTVNMASNMGRVGLVTVSERRSMVILELVGQSQKNKGEFPHLCTVFT